MSRRWAWGKRCTVVGLVLVACGHRPVSSARSEEPETQGTEEGAGGEGVHPSPAALRQKHQRRFEAARARFETEPIDQGWAAEVADAIEQQASVHLSETDDLQRDPVECRSRTCRLQIRYRSHGVPANAPVDMLSKLWSSGQPATVHFVTVPGADGQWTTGCYFFHFKRKP